MFKSANGVACKSQNFKTSDRQFSLPQSSRYEGDYRHLTIKRNEKDRRSPPVVKNGKETDVYVVRLETEVEIYCKRDTQRTEMYRQTNIPVVSLIPGLVEAILV